MTEKKINWVWKIKLWGPIKLESQRLNISFCFIVVKMQAKAL